MAYPASGSVRSRLIRATLGFREPFLAGSVDMGGSRHVPPLENVD